MSGLRWKTSVLLVMIALTSVFGTAVANASVRATSGPVVLNAVYRETEGYYPGQAVDTWLWVTVDIGSPSSAGIVGWTFDVHVDPSVLRVFGAYAATFGYFLYDFIDWNMYVGHEPNLMVDSINTTAGVMDNVTEFITNWETLGVGAGGNSYPEDFWYGMDFGLCRLRFRVVSETEYSMIDIKNAYYYTADGRKELFEVVYDGHYNEPPAIPHIINVYHTPATPNYDEEVIVSATISDVTGVDEAVLSYKHDSTWHNVSMDGFDDAFQGTIPTHPYATPVHYIVWANNTDGNSGSSEIYLYVVGDFRAPSTEVVSQVPLHPQSSQTVKIYANATEPVNASGVQTAFFSYRVNSGAWWNTTMALNEGLFESTIPQQQPNDLVEYLVKAVDNVENVNTTDVSSYVVALAGDIDLDGYVGPDDFAIFAMRYGSLEGEPSYIIECDLDTDGDVDPDDFAIFAANYGEAI